MSTPVKDLKSRLRLYLTDPSSDQDFRVWLSFALRDAHKSADDEFEPLVHAVERAFSEAADGVYTQNELRLVLADLAFEAHVSKNFRAKDSTWVMEGRSRSLGDFDPDEVVFNS